MTSASATVAAPAAQVVKQIPLSELAISLDNPRKTMDEVFLAQLADSIRQLGVQVPLLVRPFGSAPDGGYVIVAGHRRFEAAKKLKLETLPCIVRELDVRDAREIMLAENLQREDLPPLEEAEAYEELRYVMGSVESVAARVGKPIDYVTRRLKLLTLIEFSRAALAQQLITLDHALLLAKLAPAEQETALRYALDRYATRKDKTEAILAKCLKRRDEKVYGYWQPQSVLDLKAFIEREIKLELKRAPWDLADAALVASAGACVGCPKNTAANSALFGDLAVEDARCTDSVCFAAKRSAFVQVQLDAMKAAGVEAVRVSWKETSSEPRMLAQTKPGDHEKYLAQVFKAGQWIEAKKGSCAFVRTGVTVDFDEQKNGSPDVKKKPGMKLLVCVAAGCKAHRKAWEQAEKHVAGLRNENSEEARAAREKKAQAAKAENEIRAGLLKRALDGVTKLSGELLRAVVLQALPDWRVDEVEEVFPGLEDALRKSKIDSAQFARAASSLIFFNEREESFVPEWQGVDYRRAEFIAALKLLGFDGSKAWQQKPKKSSPEAPVKKAHAKKPTSSPARKKAAKKGGKR